MQNAAIDLALTYFDDLGSAEIHFKWFQARCGVFWWSGGKESCCNTETWVQSLGWEYPLKKGIASIPVFLPGEFGELRSLASYNPWSCKEWDMTRRLTHTHTHRDTHTHKQDATSVICNIKSVLCLYLPK